MLWQHSTREMEQQDGRGGSVAAYEGRGRTLKSQSAGVCFTQHKGGVKTELQEPALGMGLPSTVAERS